MANNMKRTIICLLPFVLISGSSRCQQISPSLIRDHIKTLAGDSYEGRGTGTAGEHKASAYIVAAFKKIGLEAKGDQYTYLQSFPFKHGVHGDGEAGTANNIIGYLDNKAQNTIIIGAHYDHLGTDGENNSLDANPQNKIHNGADDNASGVAGVLELARYFTGNNKKENNNFLFLCFSGEELGLLGSKYFTEHAPIELSTVTYMINMDMVGRLDPQSKTVIVNGTGTSPVWEPLLKQLASENLKIKTDSSGTGPSDHTSFYLKDIPVLHFFTGAHSDYHKPADDWEKINIAGEVSILELIASLIERLDAKPKLTFLKTKTKMQTSRSSFKVTLGIMPSYAADVEGLKVDGVTEGRPGQKAGILTGDIIVQLGDYPIKDIQQYMEALGKFEKGQTVPVKVKRKDETLNLSVTF
jgi:hypothetical protein